LQKNGKKRPKNTPKKGKHYIIVTTYRYSCIKKIWRSKSMSKSLDKVIERYNKALKGNCIGFSVKDIRHVPKGVTSVLPKDCREFLKDVGLKEKPYGEVRFEYAEGWD
jgi:hypothetical protein